MFNLLNKQKLKIKINSHHLKEDVVSISLEIGGLPGNSSIEGCWKAEPTKLPEFIVLCLQMRSFCCNRQSKDSKSLGDLANYFITAN